MILKFCPCCGERGDDNGLSNMIICYNCKKEFSFINGREVLKGESVIRINESKGRLKDAIKALDEFGEEIRELSERSNERLKLLEKYMD